MRQMCPVKRCEYKPSCVSGIVAHRCIEHHSPSPTFRRLWVNAAEDYPTFSNIPLNDCRGSVLILTYSFTPTGKSRPALPILIQHRPFRGRNPHYRLMYPILRTHFRTKTVSFAHRARALTILLREVEPELHTRGQIEAVIGVRETACQETARTDSQVVRATLHSVSNVCGRTRR